MKTFFWKPLLRDKFFSISECPSLPLRKYGMSNYLGYLTENKIFYGYIKLNVIEHWFPETDIIWLAPP